MTFDKPAAQWAFALTVSLAAVSADVLLRPDNPDGLRFVWFTVAVAAVALLAGRGPAILTLILASLALVGPLLPSAASPGAIPGLVEQAALLGFLVAGGLVIHAGSLAHHHARETRIARAEMVRALAAADIGSWSYDYRDRRLSYSDNVGPMIGRAPKFRHDSLEQWTADVHPDDLPALRDSLRSAAGGEGYEVKYRIRTPAGEWRWLLVRGRLERDRQGRLNRADGIVMDITAARVEELDRWRRSEELRTMLDLIPAGVAVAHDPRGEHITVSPRFARVLGLVGVGNASYSGEERDSFPYRCMRDGEEIPGEQLPMQLAARTGREVRDVEFDIVFDDARVMHMLASAAPLFDAEGNVRGAIGTHIDITALKQAQSELQRVARQKDVFLATLAHELRNPLAPVRYAAAILRPGIAANVLDEARRVIERQTSHMSRLLDELLDMSRITRDVIELRRDRVDLRQVVVQEIDAIRPQLAELKHLVTVDADVVDATVIGDATRLHQIVSNLVSNAAKYTNPGGHIQVQLSCDDAAQVVLCVRDNGVGIDASDLPRVFDLFSQVQVPGSSSRGGLGIGLAVVRRLVELHGGQIHACSAGRGAGAEFSVTLPLAPSAIRPVASMPRGPVDVEHAESLRVLVVDDNVDAAEVLGTLLRARGMEVRIAHDGISATVQAARQQPEVVLLDLGLPDMPGDEVARWIRKHDWGSAACIIAITGWGQPQDRERTTAAGFDHHLVKPVDPAQLFELIENDAVSKRQRRGSGPMTAVNRSRSTGLVR